MSTPREAIDELMARCDIIDIIGSYTVLKQRGSSYLGLCPFHRERTPSFSVSAEKQLFHCFGCGESGNVYSFIMKAENLGFMEAVRFLADLIHFTLPEGRQTPDESKRKALRERLYQINAIAARFFFDCLNESDGVAALAYLNSRMITPAARKRFGLGASPDKQDALYDHLRLNGCDDEILKTSGLVVFDGKPRDKFRNRLMFPIFSAMGEITGFGGRILGDGNIKYMNSPETPIFNKSENIYGINFARKSKSRQFILTEGYMDVIALNQAGFTSAVASLGTALNQTHARLLKKYTQKVVLVFDSDTAGVAAALRAIPVLEGAGIACKVLTLKNAKDPDEFIKTHGRNTFAEALSKALGSVTFRINTIKDGYDLQKTEEKAAFVSEAIKFLSTIENTAERGVYAGDVSRIANIPADAVLTEINKLVKNDTGGFTPPGELLRIKRKKLDNGVSKGVTDAQKSIIILAQASVSVAAALEGTLLPEHLSNDTYKKLLSIIYERKKTSAPLSVAGLVNYFETYDEQKTAADVFIITPPDAADGAAQNAMLTQLTREILKDYYERSAYTAGVAGDLTLLNEINENKKNLKKIDIRVVDYKE